MSRSQSLNRLRALYVGAPMAYSKTNKENQPTMRPYPTLTRPSEIDATWAMSILEQAGRGPCFKVTRKEALLNDGNPNARYQCGLAGDYYTLGEIRKWAFGLFALQAAQRPS